MRLSCVRFQRLLVPQLVVRSKCVSREAVFSFLIYLFGSLWCNATTVPSRSTSIWFCGDESEERVSGAEFVASVFFSLPFYSFFIFFFAAPRLWSSFSHRPSMIHGDQLGCTRSMLRPHAATAGSEIETSFHSHQVFVEVCGYAWLEQTLKWLHTFKPTLLSKPL